MQIGTTPLTDIAAQLEARRLSSVELTRHMLDRIARLDPVLRSFATVTEELALAQARQADAERARGIRRSPLHGVPVGIKDLCDVNGVTTAAGMPLRHAFVPDRDATVVARLRAAGAVLLGQQTMTEAATFHHHPDIAPPCNPWRPDLWPGVSSSGSGVATAAGLCFASIGSDTGGSIRFPSACTGLTGLKPTWGRISVHGSLGNAPTWDTLGPMARSAADVAILFDAVAGHDPLDPTSLPYPPPRTYAGLRETLRLDGLGIGIDRAFASAVAPDVARRTAEAEMVLGRLGAEIRDVAMPDVAPLHDHIVDLQLVELAAVHAGTYPACAERYGPKLRDGLDRGRAADPLRIGQGLVERARFRGAFARLFDSIDMLLMPVLALGTPTWAEAEAMVADGTESVMHFTGFVSACGAPSLTLPCGQTSDGRPVGFQLIGPHRSEALLLRAGHAFQQATNWHRRHPTPACRSA